MAASQVMGNAPPTQGALHILELRLAPVQADAPRGRNGLQCSLLARVGALGEELATEVAWEEPVVVSLHSEQSVVSVAIFARENGMAEAEEQFLTQICLPYSGPGCLRELGIEPNGRPLSLKLALPTGGQFSSSADLEELAVAFKDARRGVRPDRPCLNVSVRELDPARPDSLPATILDDAAWSLPPARRQLITLEIQNAALQQQRKRLMPDGADPTYEEASAPAASSCMRKLQTILEENEQIKLETMRMRQKREQAKAVLASSQRLGNPHAMDWKKTLAVMQQELLHCRERQEKIRATYEERVANLQGQLQGAWASCEDVTPDAQTLEQLEALEQELATNSSRVTAASRRREELSWELQEREAALEASRAQQNPELQRLREKAQQNEAELERLRHELAMQHGSERSQGLRATVSRLYDDIDELRRAREDERVRGESEIREVKTERDHLRDRLDDEASELQRLKSQAEVLKSMHEQAANSQQPAAANIEILRQENAERSEELERLRVREEERKATIAALEREQEVLVEQISLKANPLVDSTEEYLRILRAREVELASTLVRLRSTCREHEEEIAFLRRAAGIEPREPAAHLHHSSDANLEDDLVLRSVEVMQEIASMHSAQEVNPEGAYVHKSLEALQLNSGLESSVSTIGPSAN